MDIFEQIMKEHREVERMLNELSQGTGNAEGTFKKLKLSLDAHIEAEESSLYPAMRSAESSMIEQSIQEHRQVAQLLNQMENKPKSGDEFTNNISTLTDMIQKHVQKEESQMIPKAKNTFDQSQVQDLSSRFDEVDNRIMQMAR